MTAERVRIGTRRSPLAVAQATLVAQAIEARLGLPSELVEIVTEGDRSGAALTVIGGTGVFVGAVRQALVDGTVDLAVHSLKDLPVVPDTEVTICAIPVREDPRDALIASRGRDLDDLIPGSVVGTGSPRRAAQLRALRPDIDVVSVRGNVETRLRLVAEGSVDAVVLAMAGLVRVGRAGEATQVFEPAAMLPSPGQGALAIEVAEGCALAAQLAEVLDDEATNLSVTAERAVLAGLQGGCAAPVGALARVQRQSGAAILHLDTVVASPDGTRLLRRSVAGSARLPAELGWRAAEELLAAGAADLVKEPVP